MAGAVVEIRDRVTLQIRSYVTGEDGAYHFNNLAETISYHLRAKYSGVSSRDKTYSKYSSDNPAVFDLIVELPK